MANSPEEDGDAIELSIVVPSRNAAEVLPNQLSALSAQRADFGWEVIVVDNASEDDTARVASRFDGSLRLQVISEGVRGRHHACNRAVAAARADRVAFVDADDIVLPGYVGAMRAALERSTVVAGRLVHAAGGTPAAFGDVQSHGLMPSLGFLPYASGGNLGVWREAFLDIGGFASDVPFGEDVDLSWRLILAGADISFEPEAQVQVNQRATVRAMFTQHRRFGTAHALLYAKFAPFGMPRRPWAEIRDDWKVTLGAIPRLNDHEIRARWVRRTARSVGRVQGSFASRRLYL